MRRKSKSQKSLDLLLLLIMKWVKLTLSKSKRVSEFRASSHKARQTKSNLTIWVSILKKPDLFVSCLFFKKLTNQKRRERRKQQHTWVLETIYECGPSTEHLKISAPIHWWEWVQPNFFSLRGEVEVKWSEVKVGMVVASHASSSLFQLSWLFLDFLGNSVGILPFSSFNLSGWGSFQLTCK